jgi:plasmid stabilization system protein ParE
MKIIWRPSAVEDIEHARQYIAQFNPAAAARVFAAIRTPYLVAYTVIDREVVILAVLHHAREWPEAF